MCFLETPRMLWEESSRGKKKLMFSFLNEIETSSKFWKFAFKESVGVLLDQYASFMWPTQPSTSPSCHFLQPKSLFSHWLFFSCELFCPLDLWHLLKIQEGSPWFLWLFKKPLPPSFLTFHLGKVMLLVSHHPILSISLIIVVFLHWFCSWRACGN